MVQGPVPERLQVSVAESDVAVGADLLPAVPHPAWTDLLRTRRVAHLWPGSGQRTDVYFESPSRQRI